MGRRLAARRLLLRCLVVMLGLIVGLASCAGLSDVGCCLSKGDSNDVESATTWWLVRGVAGMFTLGRSLDDSGERIVEVDPETCRTSRRVLRVKCLHGA